jgi:hypothetical protein
VEWLVAAPWNSMELRKEMSLSQARESIDDWWNCYLEILAEVISERFQAGWRPSPSHLTLFDADLIPPASTSGR